MFRKRVKPSFLEGLIVGLMLIVGVAVSYIVYAAVIAQHDPNVLILLVVIMLFQILAILGLTLVTLKVWEQHDLPGYVHKSKQTKKK